MEWPSLLKLQTSHDYRDHFEREYCVGPIETFDGIFVRFQKKDFNHAFFESRGGEKDNVFSTPRAERMDWIRATLESEDAVLYQGWNKKNRTYLKRRRVAVIARNYVVVIEVLASDKARFVTAFLADAPQTLKKIEGSPLWKMPDFDESP